MSTPHILVRPYPAQGHVIPMMELSQCLVKHRCKITFLNTEYNHKRVLKALKEKDYIGDQISLVSVPDGLEPWEDRNDLGKLTESLFMIVPRELEKLIDKINASEGEEITCIVADVCNTWAFEVAERMKIRRAGFWPASAASLILSYNIPKLIDDGIIDNNGTPLLNQTIQLAPEMPYESPEKFIWTSVGDTTAQKIVFDVLNKSNEVAKLADWIICNSAYDLEPAAFTLAPKILPLGPLLASNRQGNSAGSFWKEDSDCLKWLDQQPPKSVIYAAFGSFTIFDKTQFQELALGLELSSRPFLWVARPDITSETNPYPEGFQERVASQGKMVGWAPQQKVLCHPSVGCFLSHCGWNSTVEGVANGLPFLCWPYFGDQFSNESYICDVWKVGVKLNRNEIGIIEREEIKNKVEQVLNDEQFIARAKELKELAMASVGDCGHSKKIFNDFVDWLNV